MKGHRQNSECATLNRALGSVLNGLTQCEEKILSPVEESQEFFSGLSAGAHASQHAASGRGAAGLLHTAHDHAQVGRLHDDTDTAGLQDLGNSKSNLLSQALLNLQSAREHLGQTSQLGEAKDTAIRDVSDVHLF